MQYREILQEEFAKRCKRNPSYSFRAFSKSIGVDASNLIKILSKKKNLSKKLATKLIEKIKLTPEERETFLNSIKKADVS